MKNNSVDLVFSLVDENNQSKSFSVTTATCKLAKQHAGEEIVCVVSRDLNGASVEIASGLAKLNGQPVTSGRLSQGDQLELGNAVYLVTQLGKWSESESSTLSSTEQAYQQRIDDLEKELTKQNRNVESMHGEFDRMSSQLDALLKAMDGTNVQADSIVETKPAKAVGQIIAEAAGSLVGGGESTDSFGELETETNVEPESRVESQPNIESESKAEPSVGLDQYWIESLKAAQSNDHSQDVKVENTPENQPIEENEAVAEQCITSDETASQDSVSAELENCFSDIAVKQESSTDSEVEGTQETDSFQEASIESSEDTNNEQLNLLNRLNELTQSSSENCGESEQPETSNENEIEMSSAVEEETSFDDSMDSEDEGTQETESFQEASIESSEDTNNEQLNLLNRLNELTQSSSENCGESEQPETSNENEIEVSSAVEEETSFDEDSQQEPEDSLGKLLASLEKQSQEKPESETEASETSADAVVAVDSIVETAELSVELKANESNGAEPDQESVDSQGNNELENLFSTLRENDQKMVGEESADAEASESEVPATDRLNELDGKLVGESSDVSVDVEEPASDLKQDSSEAPQFDSQIVETAMPVNDQSDEVHSETESQSKSERKLLDQLRSLQREQAAKVEEEDRAEAEQENASSLEPLETANVEIPTVELAGNSTVELKDESAANESAADSRPSILENLEPMSTPEQQNTESIATTQPTEKESVADVLARMNYTPDFEDDQPVQESEAPVPAQPVGHVAEATVATQEEGGEDVQDYMDSLLQRLNGGVPAPPKAAPAVQPVAEQSKPVEKVEAAPESVEHVAPLNADEFVPKRVAPELNSDLSAMRELANASSRSAVKTSNMKRRQDLGNTLLLGAGGAIVGAIATTFMSKTTGDSFYWLSVCLYVVTCVCSGLYAKSLLFGDSSSVESKKSDKSISKTKSFFNSLAKKLIRTPEAEN